MRTNIFVFKIVVMKDRKNSIVMQASILAVASIISRIIGLLYRSPLNSIIGNLGMGYYQQAYTYYTIVLLTSSYSIPAAVSKVISQRLAVGEYKNAHRIFKSALLYVLVIGFVGSAVLYCGAGWFVNDASAIPVMKIFAPTILVYGILGVFRGYFQAHNSMVQTSVSQILEQIANAVISIVAAYVMIRYAINIKNENSQHMQAIWGAMGSAIGTGAGVLVGLICILIMYNKSKAGIKQKIAQDTTKTLLGYKFILKLIIFTVTPFVLSTAIYNLSSTVNTKLYTDWYANYKGIHIDKVTEIWGLFSGQALTITNIPIAFSSAMATAMLPSVSTLIAAQKIKEAKDKIGVSVKTTMLISIPCAVGLFVLAEPIINLLFSNTRADLKTAGGFLMALSLSTVFYALSTLNSSILQGIGKVNTPIVNAAIALLVQTITAIVLLRITNLGVYSIAIATTLYAGLMCFLNQYSVKKAIAYRQEYRKSFFIPILASVIMGGVIKLVYEGMYLCVASMKIVVILAIMLGIVLYLFLLILFQCFTKQEIENFPGGKKIIKKLSKIRLMK